MILMSSKKLEYALAEEKLDSWTKVKYLILPTVLGALFSRPFYIIQPHYGKRMPNIDMLVFILCGVISAFLIYRGIKRCFHTNKSIDNKVFFERFAILSIPPLFKIITLSIIFSLTIAIIAGRLREEIPFLHKHFSMFTSILTIIIIYSSYVLINNSFIRFGKLIKEKIII